MFSTFKQRLLLGIYIFILLSIPAGAYLASQYQNIKSSAKENSSPTPLPKVTPKPNLSPAKQLLSTSESNAKQTGSSQQASSSASPPSPTIATSFGPTLSLKVNLEGRPSIDQSTKLFVGIIEGSLTNTPKYLLSFNIDLPKSGQYSNLSLAGLTSGTKYTAILKGSIQIATSSAFIMAPSVTNLNGGEMVNLLSGDLNQDNVINNTDLSIAQKAIGSKASSANWNEAADLNKDGVINIFDLVIISRNNGQVGATGAWTSPPPKVASSSASLSSSPIGSPEGGGYWMWIPQAIINDLNDL